MAQNIAWPQVVPTTDRSAATLARRHGFRTVKDLADSLPLHANVLDVGAGASTLGSVVAQLRPDIHWANLDYSYHEKRILEEVSNGAPSNLKFIAGDAAKLNGFIKPASVDNVFSYWLFPHLVRYDPQTALAAAKQIFEATRPGGTIAVGPRKHPILHPTALRGGSWRIRKEDVLTAEAFSQEILRQAELSSLNHRVRRALDEAGHEVFGTSRYVKGINPITRQFYDPASGAFVPTYKPRAMYLLWKFAARTAARLIL